MMIHHILEERLIFLFIEGFFKPLRGMVKVLYPIILDDVIQVMYDLEPTMKSLRVGPSKKVPWT